MIFGPQIKDDAIYSKYREGIAPVLKTYGGGFRGVRYFFNTLGFQGYFTCFNDK